VCWIGQVADKKNAPSRSALSAHGNGCNLQHFENTRSTHATTNAHGHANALGSTAFAFNECVPGQTLARNTIRMAHRDGAAIDVQAVARNAELVAAIESPERQRPR
jgi:hypothetical protein